jgi:Ribonuclease G/E
MPEQLIVNVTSYETRVASMEAGGVTEVAIERHRDRGIVGNVYLGKVQRVLPGMQAAFVEIGLDKAAFLYVADVVTRSRRSKKRAKKRGSGRKLRPIRGPTTATATPAMATSTLRPATCLRATGLRATVASPRARPRTVVDGAPAGGATPRLNNSCAQASGSWCRWRRTPSAPRGRG